MRSWRVFGEITRCKKLRINTDVDTVTWIPETGVRAIKTVAQAAVAGEGGIKRAVQLAAS